MVRKAKINYDEENDILWIYSGEKIKDSLEIDNFIIDFSLENKVVGVEIFNASRILSKLTLKKITKKMLKNILSASFTSFQSKELIYIIIELVLMIKKEKAKIPLQIPTPRKIMITT